MPIIEVTSKCNLFCPYCNRALFIHEDKDITIEQFNYILEKCQGFLQGPLNFNLWSEPLMNPNFLQILRNPLLKNLRPVLSTNGTLLTKQTIKALIDANVLGRIHISLQSARKDTMEFLQKGANFEKTVNNIQNLINYADGTKTQIRIQHLLTTINEDESKEDFERLLGIKLRRMTEKSTGTRNVIFFTQVLHPSSTGKQLPNETKKLWTERGRNRPIICRNIFGLGVVINVHGDLIGCCWDSSRSQTYGNIFETSMKQLRSSILLAELRQELTNRDFHRLPICKTCLDR